MNFGKYTYVNSVDMIRKVDSYLINQTTQQPNFQYTAVDTETNGLRLWVASVIGFSFSVNSKDGFYLPLVEWIPDESSLKTRTINKVKYEVFEHGHFKCVWTGKTYDEFFKPHEYEKPEWLVPILERWFGKSQLIMHNAPFDVNHIFTLTGVDLKEALFLDTALLAHIINENSPNALKEVAKEWKAELGFDPSADANAEQLELSQSVIRNGGEVTKGGKAKTIWRAAPEYQCKYAAADTFLTYGLYEVGIQKYVEDFGVDALDWIFKTEIMPVCKEVVIDMKRKGVYLDIPFFEKLNTETSAKLIQLEDEIIEIINEHLDDFSIGDSLDDAISKQRLVKRIIQLEGLSIPTKFDKKSGKDKETLAKGVIKKVYQDNPHWIWGYVLGEDEIKYSDEKLLSVKKQLYFEVVNRRYRFNIGSDAHLRWLFCDKLGFSKTDLPQTDSATKEKPIPSMKAEILIEHMLPKHEWVSKLLVFKRLRKLHSGYVKPALELNIDGWLYMDMRQNGTVSGRFACSGGFNLQTLPRVEEIDFCPECKSKNVVLDQYMELVTNRTCSDCGHYTTDIVTPSAIKLGFIAPHGYKIVNADYSSLEPRCFAYMSGDTKLKEVYWEGLDLYSKVYCDVFDDNKEFSAHPDDPMFLKKVNKKARTDTKPIVLGIPYGSSPYQVAIMCDKYVEQRGKMVPDESYGQWVTDKYLGTYKELHKYMEECEIQCCTQGFVESLCGRRRHFTWAPKIYRFLLSKGLDYKDLVDVKPWFIKKSSIDCTSNLGNKMIFTKEDLSALVKDLGLDHFKVSEGGNWSYIRNLLKADLNNSKNYRIQALAGSITNRGMLETTRLFKSKTPDSWVFLQVHDEISCYAKIDESTNASECLQIGMEDNEFAKLIDVPMIADPIICDNIKEAK